ncbi:hypothetical protein ASZ90_002845 [hydrocarbon metagenome]|uniref:Uncharacterized protein n=1 Tax=hydrocarbon metagenome TaxID=938273 RepID=A0A0W8G2E7_9ZZZZ
MRFGLPADRARIRKPTAKKKDRRRFVTPAALGEALCAVLVTPHPSPDHGRG